MSANRSMDNPCTLIELPVGEVHVWHAGLELSEAHWQQAAATLAPDERQRAARFRFERHRRHFVAGRGLLRQILGAYLGIDPGGVRLTYTACGKPCLALPRSALAFNLSHADGLAVVAVTRDREVGIDVERVRPMADVLEIAGRHFSAWEQDLLARLSSAQRQTAFFRAWTRKEAWLKASGVGLAFPLERVEVTMADGKPARPLGVEGDVQEPRRWSLHELRPWPGYIAALAVSGTINRYLCRAWRWRADDGERPSPIEGAHHLFAASSKSLRRVCAVLAAARPSKGRRVRKDLRTIHCDPRLTLSRNRQEPLFRRATIDTIDLARLAK
jgi:4'-phosphopantetheinyl transferase